MRIADIFAVFCSELEEARSLADLQGPMERLAQAASFKHFIYYLPKILGNPTDADVVLLNYPREWVVHYLTRGYTRIDPVVLVASGGSAPVDWSDLPRESRTVRTMFGEAEDAGVGRNGLSIPIHGPRGEVALMSFTSDAEGKDWEEIKRQALPLAFAAAHRLHGRAAAIARPDISCAEPRLSLRERQCRYLRRQGLGSKEIARILNISPTLAADYLASAREKFAEAARVAQRVRGGGQPE